MALNALRDDTENLVSQTDDSELGKLQQENISKVPDSAQSDVIKKAILENKDISQQQLIADYLKSGDGYQLQKDFFTPKGIGKGSPIEDFIKSPTLPRLQNMQAKLKKNRERIQKWEKVTGRKFEGESSGEFVKMVGEFFETKFIAECTPPGKDIFAKVDKTGKAHFRWSEEAAVKNLAWKRKLVDENANPLAFFDWIDTEMKKESEKRDQEIIAWAEKNLKTAQSNPKLFSPKYTEYLQKMAEKLKSGGKNNVPVELHRDFEKLVVQEHRKQRAELEKNCAKKLDAHKKLIGVENVVSWKKDWIQTADLQELQDWFKGKENKFDVEIKKLQTQEQAFLKALEKYPAEANKQEYLDWFYSLNGDEREQCFEFLETQQGKLDETQKTAIKVLKEKKEFLTPEEASQLHLKNLSELSNSEQAEKLENISRETERRQALSIKFQAREKAFSKEMQAFQNGDSDKKLEDILAPLQEIQEQLQAENCNACIDAAQDAKKLILESEEIPTESDVTAEDFVAMFLEDNAMAMILLSETYKKEGKTEEPQIEAANDNFKETATEFLEEKTQTPNAANDNYEPDWETQIALNSNYFRDSLTQNESFQERYERAQNEKAQNILDGNRELAQNVLKTKEKLSISLDTTAKDMRKETAKDVFKVIQTNAHQVDLATGTSNTIVEDKVIRNQSITKRFKHAVIKFFGEKEAKKVNATGVKHLIENARKSAKTNDNEELSRKKLAEETAKIMKLKKSANDNS